jgi:hypothetical protein
LIWEQVRNREGLKQIKKKEIKEFFAIKKDEVYKDLK